MCGIYVPHRGYLSRVGAGPAPSSCIDKGHFPIVHGQSCFKSEGGRGMGAVSLHMQSPSSFSTPPFLGQGVWGVENGWDGWQNMGITIFKEMHSLFSLFKENCHQWKLLLLPHIWMSKQSTGPRTGRVEYPTYIPRIGGGWFGAWAKKLLHTFVGSCYVLETALVCHMFHI